ncbi:MAG TPA: secretin N-terminal domain-containing protein, partial [Verrucomicrobiae bacterium]|nr:secretin N-terminal domain-containing protein [Verrucomicrobiae bacterium]
MKLNAALFSLVALTATCTITVAETYAPVPGPSQPLTTLAATSTNAATPTAQADAGAATNAPVAPAAASTNAPVADAGTNAPAAIPAAAADAATNAPAANPPPAPVAATNAPAPTAAVPTVPAAPVQVAAAADATTPAAAAIPATPADTSSNSPGPGAIIPLIVMDEVPLTDAIKNLARQAGLNYMLDPKINYGAPDATGVVHPQPTVSLRWENLTADQALNAVLANYNLIMMDDPKTHIARITIKDPAAPDPLVTKIVQLKFCDASNMVENVQTVLLDKRSKVIADSRTSQLVVVATEQELNAADQLIARLDTPTKEVLIEAKLVELQKNPSTSKGIDWSGTLSAQKVTFGNNVLGGASTVPYGTTFSQTPIQGLVNGTLTNIGAVSQITYTANNTVQNPGLLVDTAHG